jgi:uncharacterized protein YecE (DUF72 family)
MENRAYLEGVRGRLPGYELAVEFRNKIWMESERDQQRTLSFLRDQGLTYVNLDMPQGYKSSARHRGGHRPQARHGPLHGRDPKAWVKKTVQERFRYRYKPQELQEWVPRIEHLADNAERVQALMNNCYSDDAVVGARDLTALLHGEEPRPEPR